MVDKTDKPEMQDKPEEVVAEPIPEPNPPKQPEGKSERPKPPVAPQVPLAPVMPKTGGFRFPKR